MEQPLTPRMAALFIESECGLRLSASTLRRYAHDGTVPATIAGDGRISFDRAELRQVIDRLYGKK